MKKFLLALICCFALNLSFGQKAVTYSKAYHDVNEEPYPFLAGIYNDLYFTTRSAEFWSFDQGYLYKHDAGGALQFKKTLGLGIVFGISKTLDNKLIIYGRNPYCDAVWFHSFFISKRDTNGLAVFTSTFSGAISDNPRACIQMADSGYFMFSDSLLFKINKNGQYISKTNLGVIGISSALLLQNGNILLSAIYTGVKSLLILSPTGLLLADFPFPILLNKLTNYGGQKIMSLGSDGRLYKISGGFALLGNSNLPPGSVITDFVCHNDSIYSILRSSTAWSNYSRMDTAFNAISLTTTSTHSLSQAAILLNSDKVAILSSGKSEFAYMNPRYHYFTSLNVIDKTGSNNFSSDIALRAIEADSAYQMGQTDYLRVRVRVKNVGSTTITNFKLNCYEKPSVSCGDTHYQEKFSNLFLLPGDSITVTAHNFVSRLLTYFNGIPDYCFYTTVPNEDTDKTFEDNKICSARAVLLALNDLSRSETRFQVSPNPCERVVTIASENRIRSIEVMNSLGMLLSRQSLNDTRTTLDVSTLLPGVYFIRLESEKGTATKKIIKQ